MGRTIERRYLIVAGEASGDLHAARMVRSLKTLGPCRIRGVAGPALAAAGVEPIADIADLSVVGFSGVVRRLPRIWRLWRRLLAEAKRFRPDVAVLVDSPGFNLRLGPALKRAGARVFYYIAPQVWAWHPERARAMSRWVDRLAVVFPFEEDLFREAGVPVTFVGHPLLDELAPEVDEASLRAEIGASPSDRLLGILPGSREQEVRFHLEPMVRAARELRASRPDLVPVVALAHGVPEAALRAGLEAARDDRRTAPEPRVVRGRTRAVEAYSAACMVSSGTATLETALFGTPLVVVYRVSRINFAIARRVVRLPHIGLPNIVAGREVAPELIQDQLTPERLAAAVAPLLDDPGARAAARDGLALVRQRLGSPGAAGRAAALLEGLVA